jgi:hypothetical protein
MADRESFNGVAWDSASITLDQFQDQPARYQFPLRCSNPIFNYEKLAQTFEVPINRVLAAVELYLYCPGAPIGHVWVEIQGTDVNGLPNGTVLQTSNAAPAVSGKLKTLEISTGDYKICRFYFPAGVNLSSGVRYAMVLQGDFPIHLTKYVYWGFYDVRSEYSNGMGCKYNSSGGWTEAWVDECDFWFKTYYGTAIPVHFVKLNHASTRAGALPSNNGGFPAGGIIMWTGFIADIPPGYIICDGQNGTYDLVDKFVKGVATAVTDPDTTLHGEATHQLTTTEMPSHRHTAFTYQGSGQAGAVRNIIHSGTQAYTGYTGGDVYGNTVPHNNEPVYYTVAFIKKTGYYCGTDAY